MLMHAQVRYCILRYITNNMSVLCMLSFIINNEYLPKYTLKESTLSTVIKIKFLLALFKDSPKAILWTNSD